MVSFKNRCSAVRPSREEQPFRGLTSFLAAIALSLFAFAAPAADKTDFIKGFVQSESGFDGAVTVVEETVDGDLGIVTVEIPYLDIHAKTKMGQGRIMLMRREVESGDPIPVLCHVHYEKPIKGARTMCKRGWAVATAHYRENGKGYSIDVSPGDGYNLCRALLQWVRRLPFIDRSHMHIDGGSQGGYMALAMSADFFPVASATADWPVVNWAYNFSYFETNKPASKFPNVDESPLPVLCSVTGLADACYALFGNDLTSETWYRLSPISYLDRITNPVLILCQTGDMLVPIEQMTQTCIRPFDKARFPDGYTRDFDALTLCEPAKTTFEALLPKDSVSITVMPLQENSFEISYDMLKGKQPKPEKRPADVDRPWSKDHQWSLCYLDEGAPTPYATHTSYEWAVPPDTFVSTHQKSKLTVENLNPAKLDHLMRRYLGQLENSPRLADRTPCNRLNFPNLEKTDVSAGLLDYAALGHNYASRLKYLYRQGQLHPFGPDLHLDSLKTPKD
jgi:hypothetical protein